MQQKKIKIRIKSTQADMCLKYFKKEWLIYLYAFLKAFNIKSRRGKISGRKLLITS